MVRSSNRVMVLFLAAWIIVLPMGGALADDTNTQSVTWGRVKAMYGNDNVPPQPQQVPGTLSIGSWMSIAWPFGSDGPNNWSGDEGERTGGASGWFCGGTRNNTHSGADYYARDLNRNDGRDEGKPIYAGISGKVVIARYDGGYGNTVVIYDATRRQAIRYAHLAAMAVYAGQYVSLRQYIGTVGRTGFVSGPHLHLAGYTNIDHFYKNGDPVIPTLCDSDYYACAVYFFS